MRRSTTRKLVPIALLMLLPQAGAVISQTTQYDGTYNYSYQFNGPNGPETHSIPSGFIIKGGQISTATSPSQFSGTVSTTGAVSFIGPCPQNPGNAGFTGQLTISGGTISGGGKYVCNPNPGSGSWSVTLASRPTTFDFGISVTPASITVVQGGDATYTVKVSLVSGTPQTVTLQSQTQNAPPGFLDTITAGFGTDSGLPPFTTTLTIHTNASTPTGTVTKVVHGEGGGVVHDATTQLTVVSKSNVTGCNPLPNILDFGVRLVGLRTGPTNYVNIISDSDTLFFDGVFSQPAPPFHCVLRVDVYVTVTGADEVPVNYRASVEASIASVPPDSPPATWVTISPGTTSRPIGLWDAVPTAVISASDAQGRYDIGTIHGDRLTFFVTSASPATTLNVGGTRIPIFGDLSGVVITGQAIATQGGTTTLSFNAAGPPGMQRYMTLVIAKVPPFNSGVAPVVVVNGQQVALAGTPVVQQCLPTCPVADFLENATHYMIRITMHFSTNLVEIQFKGQSNIPSIEIPTFTYLALSVIAVLAVTALILSRTTRKSRGQAFRPRPEAAPAANFCPSCGAQVAMSQVFCENCGAKVR